MDTVVLRATTLVDTGEKHCNYDTVTKFASEYAAHITGVGIDKYLKRFTIRESLDMFKQRCEITEAISPAVASSLMKPFYKVSRNNNITQKYDFKNPDLNKRVEIMLNDFNSDMMDNTNGLDTWLRSRFVELTFIDPNGFVVIEWDAPKSATETIKPRPFEVSSAEAYNYEYKGQVLQWLHVRTEVKYHAIVDGKICAKDGVKWTHYAQGVTLVFEPVDDKYRSNNAIELLPNQVIKTIGGNKYVMSTYITGLDYVPAFKVGYARDLNTSGRTYVNPFNSAMPYFRKMLKTTSELDITMNAHAFPQKWQYTQKCQGASPTEPCENGKCPTRDNAVCTACNGTGTKKAITSAQEVFYIPLPDDPKEAIDLEKMQAYKSPPIDLVKWQDEYIRLLKQDTHLAVYNSNMFLASDAQFAKTATEIETNMDGIYDAIEPYSEKYSKVWKLIVYTCAALGGLNQDSNDYDLVHAFPADPKLKTLSILLGDLKQVNDSDAPSFTRDIINNDIAEVVFNGDDEALMKYRTRHEFYPFNGKKTDEITMLLSTQYVSDFTKILYSNFEAIFSEIEREEEKFYLLPYAKQWEVVEAKVNEWRDDILNNTPERPDVGLLLGSRSAAAGTEDTGSNDTGNDDQQTQATQQTNTDGPIDPMAEPVTGK